MNLFNLNIMDMNAIIKLKDGLLFYKNIHRIRVENAHIVVECNGNYSVNERELLRNNNISTKPFIHCFYDAEILSCNEANG